MYRENTRNANKTVSIIIAVIGRAGSTIFLATNRYCCRKTFDTGKVSLNATQTRFVAQLNFTPGVMSSARRVQK